jgi:hypothetical protein
VPPLGGLEVGLQTGRSPGRAAPASRRRRRHTPRARTSYTASPVAGSPHLRDRFRKCLRARGHLVPTPPQSAAVRRGEGELGFWGRSDWDRCDGEAV